MRIAVAVRFRFGRLVVTRERRNVRSCSHCRLAFWSGGRVGGGHFLSSEPSFL